MSKYFHSPGYIQDGKLDQSCGRIILYQGTILVSRNVANDHNDLLRAFASRFEFKPQDVISSAIRMYYIYLPEEKAYIICGVRSLDDQMFIQNADEYSTLIKRELK